MPKKRRRPSYAPSSVVEVTHALPEDDGGMLKELEQTEEVFWEQMMKDVEQKMMKDVEKEKEAVAQEEQEETVSRAAQDAALRTEPECNAAQAAGAPSACDAKVGSNASEPEMTADDHFNAWVEAEKKGLLTQQWRQASYGCLKLRQGERPSCWPPSM